MRAAFLRLNPRSSTAKSGREPVPRAGPFGGMDAEHPPGTFAQWLAEVFEAGQTTARGAAATNNGLPDTPSAAGITESAAGWVRKLLMDSADRGWGCPPIHEFRRGLRPIHRVGHRMALIYSGENPARQIDAAPMRMGTGGPQPGPRPGPVDERGATPVDDLWNEKTPGNGL